VILISSSVIAISKPSAVKASIFDWSAERDLVDDKVALQADTVNGRAGCFE
jgi:hypothetical protein